MNSAQHLEDFRLKRADKIDEAYALHARISGGEYSPMLFARYESLVALLRGRDLVHLRLR